jgi:deazaflavin-dependent oxidoreductase (nitroreductase family)
VVTLEVPGRRSGAVRRTNLVQARHEGQRYLVSLTGESEWVRNARAAGGRVVLARRGRRRAATLVEVPVEDRGPVIRSYVLRAGRRPDSAAVAREARAFFGVGPGLAIEEIATVADRFPVFRVVPDPDEGGSGPGRSRWRGRPRLRGGGPVRTSHNEEVSA